MAEVKLVIVDLKTATSMGVGSFPKIATKAFRKPPKLWIWIPPDCDFAANEALEDSTAVSAFCSGELGKHLEGKYRPDQVFLIFCMRIYR